MTYSVAVSGASGYAGGEILRLLADHPDFEVRTVPAHANAGQPLVAVQPQDERPSNETGGTCDENSHCATAPGEPRRTSSLGLS